MDVPPIPGSVEHKALVDLLDGRWAEVRRGARERMLSLPGKTKPPVTDLDGQRAEVLEQLRELAASGYPKVGFPVAVGGQGDIGGAVTAFEMLGFGDLSLMVKAGVQWGLFGGAVELLGTQRH